MKVTFDNVYNAFQIIAPKGTMISFTGEPTALADGVYLVGDDGIINLDEQFLTDTLYLSTEGTDYAVTGGMRVTYPLGDETVIIRAGSSTIPFSKGGKGGGGSGGDNTHYKGTTTTPISNGSKTNPITIDGESYTAIFGDIVVYGYTEFVFDGSAWSEFGRPFDTTPTSGSANAVTSDGIYKLVRKDTGAGTVTIGGGTGLWTHYQPNMVVCGYYNTAKDNDIFEIGAGANSANRKNIVEVNSTELNVNGDIRKNNVSLPTPYTTMPTITAAMLGQIAQYVGTTDANYTKGWFYEAVSDGEETPTYSWEAISFNSGGGGGETETNIIPLATPNVVVVDSDYYSNVYKNDYNGISFSKSYDYGAQPSCYIDVSSLVSSDILCSGNTKIKIQAFLTSNWGGALSNTLQMYIGDGEPTSNDWVTVVTHAVSESTPYGYYDTIDVSDINVSGTSDGRIYFRMIHGSETNSFDTWIQIVSLDIIHMATPEEPSVTFKGGIIDELYTYEVIE